MRKKTIFAIVAIMSMVLLIIPAKPFVCPDGYEDAGFEQYGPRADKLLIHLYADDTTEFTAMESGSIDICDWPLPKTVYTVMSSAPYNQTIKIVNYGAEYVLYTIDMNCNNNTYMGNPPDPANGNNPSDVKVYNPNTDASYNWMADIWLRRAIDYLINRPALIADPSIGAGFGYPMYTTIPPTLGKYLLDVTTTNATWAYTYSRVLCNQTLDQHGYNVIDSVTGWREYRGQDVNLQFYIRSDHPGRVWIGTELTTEMQACGLQVTTHFENSGACYVDVVENKNFHMYTGGWSLSAQPDYLILWDWAYYWHPGFCYNYAGCNDPAFNADAEGIMSAKSQAEAVSMAFDAQYRQAYMVLGAPVYCVAGNKAYHIWNTGGDAWDTTEKQDWLGVVNEMGYGIDNRWSFMDMHTNDTEWGKGMTIDYGFKVPELKDVNILYATSQWDINVLGEIYESLLVANSSNADQLMPWIASSYSVGTYVNPVYGTCTKVRFTLRPDVYWSDGTPLTVADVGFSFVEVKKDLAAKGHAPPYWFSNVQDILGLNVLDPYNFEVLLDRESYWALYWIGGNYIIPEHIWKPIILTGDPEASFADPNCVGSGPWTLTESDYVADSYVLLLKNPTYHRGCPIYATVAAVPSGMARFDSAVYPTSIVNVTIYNMMDPTMPGHSSSLNVNCTVVLSKSPTYPAETILVPGMVVSVPPSEGLVGVKVSIPMTWHYGNYDFEVFLNWPGIDNPVYTAFDGGKITVKYKIEIEALFCCARLPSTSVYLNPFRISGVTGQTVNVTFEISNVTSLCAFQAGCIFNPLVAHCLGVFDGGFLGSRGGIQVVSSGSIDNVHGEVSPYSYALNDTTKAPTGSGALMIFEFQMNANSSTGLSDVHIIDWIPIGKDGNEIPSSTIDYSTTSKGVMQITGNPEGNVITPPYAGFNALTVQAVSTSVNGVMYNGNLSFTMYSPDANTPNNDNYGVLSVTIPKTLMTCNASSQWYLSLNGVAQSSMVVSENATDTFLSLQFTYSVTGLEQVEILSVYYWSTGQYETAISTTGKNVTVSPASCAHVTFTNITTTGALTMNITQPSSNATGLTSAANSVFVSFQTTATYHGNVTLQFKYNPTGLTLADQKAIRMWLWNTTSSTWRDITTYVNTTTNTIYGVSPHLSCFAITCTLSFTGSDSMPVQTVVQTPSAPPAGLPNSLEALAYYDIQAATQDYKKPVTVRLTYDPKTISSQQAQFLQMWLWNETLIKWVDITTRVDTANNMLIGVSPHLSCFAITSLQPFPAGIVMVGATCSKTVVGMGYSLNISVSIQNRGGLPQSLTVFVYANNTAIYSVQVSNLVRLGLAVVAFRFTDSASLAYGNYSISACDQPISHVTVTIPGDINGDGKVNLVDVFNVALAFGSELNPADGKYWRGTVGPFSPNLDLNGDGKINLIDYFNTALNFGKAWPARL